MLFQPFFPCATRNTDKSSSLSKSEMPQRNNKNMTPPFTHSPKENYTSYLYRALKTQWTFITLPVGISFLHKCQNKARTILSKVPSIRRGGKKRINWINFLAQIKLHFNTWRRHLENHSWGVSCEGLTFQTERGIRLLLLLSVADWLFFIG